MFKIGDFSKLTFVSIRMLRYYDELDLFKPVHVDDFTSYRYYSAKQIPVLNTIITLKELGFKLNEIKQVLQQQNEKGNKQFLIKKQDELQLKLQKDQTRLAQLSQYINNFDKENNSMKYDVVIKDIPKMKVVSIRRVLSAYDQEGILWGEMMSLVGKHNIGFGPRCLAQFSVKETENGADVEILLEVTELREDIDGLTFYELPEIKGAATILVAGDYVPNIQQGFNYMATWLEENNHSISGSTRTYYIKGPGEEKNSENYLTEIVVPFKTEA